VLKLAVVRNPELFPECLRLGSHIVDTTVRINSAKRDYTVAKADRMTTRKTLLLLAETLAIALSDAQAAQRHFDEHVRQHQSTAY
jgi:hypothetical protein